MKHGIYLKNDIIPDFPEYIKLEYNNDKFSSSGRVSGSMSLHKIKSTVFKFTHEDIEYGITITNNKDVKRNSPDCKFWIPDSYEVYREIKYGDDMLRSMLYMYIYDLSEEHNDNFEYYNMKHVVYMIDGYSSFNKMINPQISKTIRDNKSNSQDKYVSAFEETMINKKRKIGDATRYTSHTFNNHMQIQIFNLDEYVGNIVLSNHHNTIYKYKDYIRYNIEAEHYMKDFTRNNFINLNTYNDSGIHSGQNGMTSTELVAMMSGTLNIQNIFNIPFLEKLSDYMINSFRKYNLDELVAGDIVDTVYMNQSVLMEFFIQMSDKDLSFFFKNNIMRNKIDYELSIEDTISNHYKDNPIGDGIRNELFKREFPNNPAYIFGSTGPVSSFSIVPIINENPYIFFNPSSSLLPKMKH